MNELGRSCNSVVVRLGGWAIATVGLFVGLFLAPVPCRAQSMATGPLASWGTGQGRPPVSWIGLGRPGDASGAVRGDPIGELAIEPLRLSLLGNHPTMPLDAMSPCRDSLADVQSGRAPTSFMRTYAMNLLAGPGSSWKLPRLTLFGFSRFGCTLDGAAGAGASFTVPIRQDVFFVASAGAIYLPATGAQALPEKSTSARADIVFRQPDGRSLSVGLGTLKGLAGVSMGGVF